MVASFFQRAETIMGKKPEINADLYVVDFAGKGSAKVNGMVVIDG